MKTKKKSLAAVMCVLLAILTVFVMMPNLSYADAKGGHPKLNRQQQLNGVPEGWKSY